MCHINLGLRCIIFAPCLLATRMGSQVYLGHRLTMIVNLQTHSGIPTVLQVSRGRVATHIVH